MSSSYNLTHLKVLEAESIHIIREVAAEFERPVMLYSIGKDSAVMLHLAKAIARDGEGATKLVEIRVTGAPSDSGARSVAKTIAESPLVKTALFGNDPNWGRLMAAAGRAGIPFDPAAASASIAGIEVYRAGVPTDFNAAEVSDAMKLPDVLIEVNLGDPAGGAFTFYTCDFSYDYVRINAEYTT